MNRFLIGGVIVIMAVILGLSFFKRGGLGVSQNNTSAAEEYRSADKILDLAFVDFNGNNVRLREFGKKHMLVNGWAVSCSFCKQELSDFAEVQKDFGDKLTIVAINRAATLDAAKKYSDELGITDKLVFLLDPADSFYQTIGGFSMPETVFIDREGKIRYHKRGHMELEEIRRRVQDAFGL